MPTSTTKFSIKLAFIIRALTNILNILSIATISISPIISFSPSTCFNIGQYWKRYYDRKQYHHNNTR